jgi:Icc protein
MPISLPPLSRRQFLGRALLGGTSLALAPRVWAAAFTKADPHAWALLSDTHIPALRTQIAREVKPCERLANVVSEVLAWETKPAGVLVNGDLALGTGEAADYATFSELISPLRAAGLPLHLTLGNHDNRERFWAGLAQEKRVQAPLADRQVSVVRADRANWFVLDSLDKTNSTPGVLGAGQMEWLARTLDAHTDRPALVMVHHNPNAGTSKGGLTETEPFLDLLRARRHVKAWFFGHSHRWSVTEDKSGLQLVNLPATSYPFDKEQPTGWVMARLERDGLRLELNATDRKHPAHGEVKVLRWRS